MIIAATTGVAPSRTRSQMTMPAGYCSCTQRNWTVPHSPSRKKSCELTNAVRSRSSHPSFSEPKAMLCIRTPTFPSPSVIHSAPNAPSLTPVMSRMYTTSIPTTNPPPTSALLAPTAAAVAASRAAASAGLCRNAPGPPGPPRRAPGPGDPACPPAPGPPHPGLAIAAAPGAGASRRPAPSPVLSVGRPRSPAWLWGGG